jgi:hypothetical protein
MLYSTVVTVASYGLFWLLVFLVAIQAVSALIGTWFGRRLVGDAPPRAEATGLVTGGVLGLTAFVLALTLSFGTGRMSERRAGALEEANAIGTAWLQATALSDPRAIAIAAFLEDYAQARLDFATAEFHSPDIQTLSAKTDGLQSQIWAEMTGLLAERTDPHTVSLMNAINHVFDMTASERLSLSSGMPQRLVEILVGMICISAAVVGFQMGLKKQWAPVLVGLLFTVWSAVIVTVLDFGAPRLGGFRTVTDPYVWTIESFGQPPP